MPAALDGAPVNEANNRSTCHSITGPSACIYASYTTGTCLVSCVFFAASTSMTRTRMRKPRLLYTYGHFQVSPVPKVAPNYGHVVCTPQRTITQHLGVLRVWHDGTSQLMFKADCLSLGK